jgi:hypothetical protein
MCCVLTVWLQGSSAEVREAAAEGLGELVSLTTEEGLKPFTVAITGPLIRIIGDRFPGTIKAAILVTLGLLIEKAGPGLKPFVPQLQTTFLKCLNDPVRGGRGSRSQGQTTIYLWPWGFLVLSSSMVIFGCCD